MTGLIEPVHIIKEEHFAKSNQQAAWMQMSHVAISDRCDIAILNALLRAVTVVVTRQSANMIPCMLAQRPNS